MCQFCNKKEQAFLKVTGKSYGMGQKCYKKGCLKGIEWAEDATLKELREKFK